MHAVGRNIFYFLLFANIAVSTYIAFSKMNKKQKSIWLISELLVSMALFQAISHWIDMPGTGVGAGRVLGWFFAIVGTYICLVIAIFNSRLSEELLSRFFNVKKQLNFDTPESAAVSRFILMFFLFIFTGIIIYFVICYLHAV